MLAPAASSTQSEGESDSDWDDDDDFVSKKINIKIKPIAQVTPSKMSASVDELRATVGTWKSLANINLVKPNSRRHHQSNLQLNNPDQQTNMLVPSATSSVVLPESLTFNNLNDELNVHKNNHLQHYKSDLKSTSSNLRMLDSDNLPHRKTTQELENFSYLYPTTLELTSEKTLVPSNSFLQPTPLSTILSPGFQNAFNETSVSTGSTRFPVAFAIQECLNAKLSKGSEGKCLNQASIFGRVKLAVPPTIFDTDYSKEDFNLVITMKTSLPWEKIRLNKKLIRRLDQLETTPTTPNSTVKLAVDMRAIQDFVKRQYPTPINLKYFVVPELLKYAIGSQEKKVTLDSEGLKPLNPINPLAHWLCDLNITKVRVDLTSVDVGLEKFGLSTNDIKNLKISMSVNGGVVSYQSKPEANWNNLDSRLSWSFSNLSELVQKSTLDGTTSCLARFDLNDGPSTPSDVSLQFSITGKTLSGTQIILNSLENFRLAAQRFEVRTGTFRCEPPHL